MHNLHLLLVHAASADAAAGIARALVTGFGDEDNNLFQIGGIASEDGCDDQNEHDTDTRYPLSRFDDDPAAAKEGTYFARAVEMLLRELSDPPDLRTALDKHADELREVRIPDGIVELWKTIEELKRLFSILYSRCLLSDGDIPEFRRYEFNYFGLTAIDQEDKKQQDKGTRRYIVCVDMHS
jgi:hypothetical protein